MGLNRNSAERRRGRWERPAVRTLAPRLRCQQRPAAIHACTLETLIFLLRLHQVCTWLAGRSSVWASTEARMSDIEALVPTMLEMR